MWIDKYNAEGYYDPTNYEAMRELIREELKRRYGTEYRPLVFICSPFAGDMEGNAERTRKYCRFAVEQYAIPVAPHLLYPQFMDEHDPDSRKLGLFFGRVLLGKCQELWVFGDTISDGMSYEIRKAQNHNMPIKYFTEECEVKTL
ncbi:MAG: DUF4406 domain-containing protein [Bacilli bacterium]|jgi:hypothetical protein